MSNEIDNNRLKRLQVLDELLSTAKEGVSMAQMIDNVKDSTGVESDRFAINRDLDFLKDRGYEIIEEKKAIRDEKNQQSRNIILRKYKNPGNTLFKISLSEEERIFLSDAMAMLGLKGLDTLKIFQKLKLKSTRNSKMKIISFTKNPIEKQVSKSFDYIFDAIRLKEVIQIGMHDRKPPYKVKKHTVHPWYLHEYNRRWYMFGFDEEEQKMKRFSLDRIDKKPKVKEKIAYRPANITMEEILRDVVGVSVDDGEVITVLFWVSYVSADYVSKKLIHHSQKEVSRKEAEEMVGRELDYEGGKYFTIVCKENYELRREMLSFGAALVVLAPDGLRNSLRGQLEEMLGRYE